MTIPDSLDPADHPWMDSSPVRRVMAALEGAKLGGSRYVGGCVRNALMGEPVADIDIATQLTPDQATDALEEAGIRVAPTGLAHGTVTAALEGVGVEITTLRRDVSTDGRRATVAFTEDWAEDSGRRDFRFNAIYCAPDGTLFDPQNGVADTQERRVVFIGDADRRIAEDALRILRFFRMQAQYGKGRPDREGLLACARHKAMIGRLSGERIWTETKKLLSAPAPEATLRWMQTAGLLNATFGECNGLEAAAQFAMLAREEDWGPHPVLMLAALTEAGEAKARKLADRLKMSRAEKARMLRAARMDCPTDEDDAPADALPARLYRDGAENIADRAMLCRARMRAKAGLDNTPVPDAEAMLAEELAAALVWEEPEFPVTGKDLAEIGVAPGPDMGRALATLESRWIDSGFTLDRAALLEAAKDL